MKTLSCLISTALLCILATTADAADADARSYALVVGSNPGGQGQQTLRYAESDAGRVAQLLRDVGGYDSGHVELITGPTAADLLGALDRIAARIQADAARGESSRFFFYYSGHARARALNLGREELALTTLRERILAVPATLTIVVLDACQSGAFSRIKGAEPAADFSFNSVSRLNSKGVAVMASSSGTELSQESERLRASYFTHHLLVALRGAGDENGDGQVSLDEAYGYAYQRTLSSTAATAVGSQHVTLETDLKGKGDVAISYPARADSHLALASELEAEVLVQTGSGGAVVAEVHKSKNSPLRLALPRGRYLATVRTGGQVHRCDVTLARGRVAHLHLGGCRSESMTVSVSKGDKSGPGNPGIPGPPGPGHRYGLEFSGGFTGGIRDAYTDRLEDFGFNDQLFVRGRVHLAGIYRLSENIGLVLDLGHMEAGRYSRGNEGGAHVFSWTTRAAGLYFRGELPGHLGPVIPFAQAGGGLARAETRYEQSDPGADVDVFWGYHLGAAAGARIMFIQHLGSVVRFGYDYAPVIDNLTGDTHNSGGPYGTIGLYTQF